MANRPGPPNNQNQLQWLDFMFDSLEPDEVWSTKTPLYNVKPVPRGTRITPELVQQYFSRHYYPYSRRMHIRTYYRQKIALQVELVKLQNWVRETGQRLIVLFEGRDAAGKGSTIKRFMEHLNPRAARVVALEKPTDHERGQWYFQRYVDHFPSRGEIVFFDRSWYNRAGVERVMGFCTEQEYVEFTRHVPIFEKMLVNSGLSLVKFYLSVSGEEQARRIDERKENPLKQWKLSSMDLAAQQRWDEYTDARNAIFKLTDSEETPWIVVKGEDKMRARIETMRFVLHRFDYTGKDPKVASAPDPLIVTSASNVLDTQGKSRVEKPGQ